MTFSPTPEMILAATYAYKHHGFEQCCGAGLSAAIRAVAPLILAQSSPDNAGLVKRLREAAGSVDDFRSDASVTFSDAGYAGLAALLREAADELSHSNAGWRTVPEIPTPEMCEAGCSVIDDDADMFAFIAAQYRAMLAAAPATPSQRQSDGAAQSESPPDESFVRVPVVKG